MTTTCYPPLPEAAARTVPTATTWSLALPVKGGHRAKSRLLTAMPVLAVSGAELAAGIALDTLEVVAATPGVRARVVTSDQAMARRCRELGLEVLAETSPGSGLPRAVQDAVDAEAGRPAGGGPCAVLLPDLPSLRPPELAAALGACAARLAEDPDLAMVAVPDAEGVGTVLLAARSAGQLRHSFGAGSAGRHARLGAELLDLDLPRLRRDVDTVSNLRTAVQLGVGPRTARALAGWSPSPDRPGRADA